MLVLAGAILFAVPGAAAFDPYVVEGVRVAVTADDAVMAKDKALSQAVEEAAGRVLRRVTAETDRAALPVLREAAAQRLLDRLAIQSERVGPDSYAAEIKVVFSPLAVRGYLSRHGARAVDDPAPPVLIVPVLIDSGIPMWWGDASEWAAALARARFEDGLTPVRFPVNSASDRAERPDRILNADRVTLGALRVRYRTQGVVAVSAARIPGRDRVELRVVGEDAAGPVDLRDNVAAGGLDAAAEKVRDLLSERWKAALRGAASQTEASVKALSVRVLLHDGEAEWVAIRRRLEESGLLHGMAVEAEAPNSVSVLIWHGGSATDLAGRLARHRLDLFQAGGSWLLQSY